MGLPPETAFPSPIKSDNRVPTVEWATPSPGGMGVALDLDDLLRPFMDPLSTAVRAETGSDISPLHLFYYFHQRGQEQRYAPIVEVAESIARQPRFIRSLPLYPNVPHQLALAYASGVNTHILTAQPEELRIPNTDMLADHGITPLVLSLQMRHDTSANIVQNKIDACLRLGLTVMVDDSLFTLLGAQEAGIHGICVTNEFNGSITPEKIELLEKHDRGNGDPYIEVQPSLDTAIRRIIEMQKGPLDGRFDGRSRFDDLRQRNDLRSNPSAKK